MEREFLRNILLEMYAKDSIKSILSGRMKPSYENMLMLKEKYNIPFEAWQDIKTFIKEKE